MLFNVGAKWWWVINATPWPLYPQERDLVRTVQEAVWAPEPVWAVAENLVSTGILLSDRPDLRDSLC